MLDLTPIARHYFKGRMHLAGRYERREGGVERLQADTLRYLTGRLARTLYGREHGLAARATAVQFARALPLVRYEDIRPLVMRMLQGERNVLWPGQIRTYAQSSGTSDGKSKYIPIGPESLRVNHYPGASDAVAMYLGNYPDSRLFSGKAFILGGSFATEVQHGPRVQVGDLSASLIQHINPVVNLLRVPSKRIALMADWRAKVPALVAASRGENITNLSGVPSWFLTVLKEVLRATGAPDVHRVWPSLEVFFHGGISMEPYREQYGAITAPGRLRYVENYNASEGFFAAQDLREPGQMLLLLDRGVFYEFIPMGRWHLDQPPTLTAAQVQAGHTYELVITAPNGLSRYRIGDTVTVTSTNPLRIRIAGRTKHYINAFGEEVMVHNSDQAVRRACLKCHCSVMNYTVAPVFANGTRKGRHQWLIEWNNAPANVAAFAAELDLCLQTENSDYQAKRSGGIFLDAPLITTAPQGLFDRWLLSTGKLGGQRKIPRLSNDRRFIDSMLALTATGPTTEQST